VPLGDRSSLIVIRDVMFANRRSNRELFVQLLDHRISYRIRAGEQRKKAL